MAELCKVLIVDDEYIMRQGIKHLINWDQEGFLIVGEATNGEEALLLVEREKPHIVVMDVVMPVIDGVELTKILHDKYPEIQLIVLSGFDKFEYVKETLKNGAMDYILKPTLTAEEFLGALKRAAENIPDFNFSTDRNLNLNHAIEWYLSGYYDRFPKEEFPDFSDKDSYRILAFDMNYAYGNNSNSIKWVRKLIRSELEEIKFVFGRTTIDDKNLVYVINYDSGDDELLKECLEETVLAAKNKNKKAFFVLSSKFDDVQDIKEVYQKEIEQRLCEGFYNEQMSLMLAENSTKKASQNVKFDYNDYTYLLRNGEFDKAIDKMKTYMQQEIAARDDCDKIKNKAKNLIYNIIVLLEDYDVDIDKLRRRYFEEIDDAMFVDEFVENIDMILAEIKEEIEENVSGTDLVLNEITKYISEHYNENLDLDTLARTFNYNYNYLSTYFNSKYNEGFSGYLNKVRIDKACEMLRKDNMAIADISYTVGYSDHSYFCRVFKKMTGYTPSVYRKRFR